jgi:hypothetical protein
VLKLGAVVLDGTKIHAALSYERAGQIEMQRREEVGELTVMADAADQAGVTMGCRSPKSWRGVKSGSLRSPGRAIIVARPKERPAREQAEHAAKIAERAAKSAETAGRPAACSACGKRPALRIRSI